MIHASTMGFQLALLYALFGSVLSWMTSLAPGRDHVPLAWAIAQESHADPLPGRSDLETAALVTAIAFRESGFRNDITGDHGRSQCAMQILDGQVALRADPTLCVQTGLAKLHAGWRVDPAQPVAVYARGPRHMSREARALSRDRELLAARLLGSP